MDIPQTVPPLRRVLEQLNERLSRIEAAVVSRASTPTELGSSDADAGPRLLTVREVASRWSTRERRVRDLLAAGRIHGVRLGQRGVRVPISEVEKFERACRA